MPSICLISAPHAGVAQLVEQRIRNAKVVGSTPISGTNCVRVLSWYRDSRSLRRKIITEEVKAHV